MTADSSVDNYDRAVFENMLRVCSVLGEELQRFLYVDVERATGGVKNSIFLSPVSTMELKSVQ